MLRIVTVNRITAFSPSASRAALLFGALAAAACSGSPTTSGAAANVIPWSGQDQVAPVGTAVPAPIQVRVTDASGNSLSGVAVTLATTAGTLGETSGVSGDEGLLQTTFTVGTKTGNDTVTVTVAGVTTPAVFVFTATAGDPVSIAIVAGDNQTATAGSALPTALAVEVLDQYGNAVPGASLNLSADNGSVGASSAQTDANGMAQVPFTLGSTPGVDTVVVTTGTAGVVDFTETAD